jgi:hypothetical protein
MQWEDRVIRWLAAANLNDDDAGAARHHWPGSVRYRTDNECGAPYAFRHLRN